MLLAAPRWRSTVSSFATDWPLAHASEQLLLGKNRAGGADARMPLTIEKLNPEDQRLHHNSEWRAILGAARTRCGTAWAGNRAALCTEFPSRSRDPVRYRRHQDHLRERGLRQMHPFRDAEVVRRTEGRRRRDCGKAISRVRTLARVHFSHFGAVPQPLDLTASRAARRRVPHGRRWNVPRSDGIVTRRL